MGRKPTYRIKSSGEYGIIEENSLLVSNTTSVEQVTLRIYKYRDGMWELGGIRVVSPDDLELVE
jgi:hypothetical protein